MERRQLGNSDLRVRPLAFGGNVFGWTIDEKTSFDLLDAFVGAGFDFIDTADIYSSWVPGHTGGESEAIIGRWMKARGNRDKIVVATKCGMDMGGDNKGLSRRWITQAVEDSLRRLQTDYIDLYQSHADDPATPLEETAEAFADLHKAGKVRVLGASNFSVERLADALAVSKRLNLPRYESLQPEYNLYARADFESGLQKLCVKEKIGVIPYFPLAAGFLSGKYRSEADFGKSPRGGGMKKYLNARGLRILGALDEVAKRAKATPAQIAIAWLLARPAVTAPIASATNRGQLDDLVKAVALKMSDADMALLNQASAP